MRRAIFDYPNQGGFREKFTANRKSTAQQIDIRCQPRNKQERRRNF